MNKKGFAASGIIYAILVLFLFLIFGLISMLGSRKMILDRLKNNIMSELNGEKKLSDYNIRISDIHMLSATNGSYEVYESTHTYNTTSFYAFLNPNSSITYEAEVINNNPVDYIVQSIVQQESINNDDITIDISLQPADVIGANSKRRFTITVTNTDSDYHNVMVALMYNFVENKFVVNFDANGGTVNTVSKEVSLGSSYGVLPTPTKAGYIFKGWNGKNKLISDFEIGGIDNNGNKVTVTDAIRTTDYIPIKSNTKYTISNNANYNQYIYEYGYNEQFKRYKNGNSTYTFTTGSDTEHIKVKESGNNINAQVQLEEGDTATEYEPYYVTRNTTVTQAKNHLLTAVWEPKRYVVTLDANGGTVSDNSLSLLMGEEYGAIPTPSKSGYNFLGWNGKNKFNKEEYERLSDYTISSGGLSWKEINLKPNTTYTYSIDNGDGVTDNQESLMVISSTTSINASNAANWVAIENETNDFGGYRFNEATEKVLTTGNDGKLYIGCACTQQDMQNIWGITNIQIEEGVGVTPYEPYYVTSTTHVTLPNDHTLTAIWQEAAATSYIVTLYGDGGLVGTNIYTDSMFNTGSDVTHTVSNGVHTITPNTKPSYPTIYISKDSLVKNKTYILKYKIQKTAGTLVKMGGHSQSTRQIYFKYDGIEQESYHDAVTVADDTSVHTIEYKFEYLSSGTQKDIYIQPNRGDGTAITFKVFDIELYEMNSSQTKEVDIGSTYGSLPNAERNGYIFKGWNGKNKFNELLYTDLSNYTISSGGLKWMEISLKPNTNYTYQRIKSGETGNQGSLMVISSTTSINASNAANWVAIENETNDFGDYNFNESSTKTLSTGNDGKLYIGCSCMQEDIDYIWPVINIQLEEGSTVTAYEPYYVTNTTPMTQTSDHTLTAIWKQIPTSVATSATGLMFISEDDFGDMYVCIHRNNDVECYKEQDTQKEGRHAIKSFGASNCDVDGDCVYCADGIYHIYIEDDGIVNASIMVNGDEIYCGLEFGTIFCD